ncbi:uncharacterized protein si:ch211-80h18.1 [Xyrichtys novacula]|uniref:Uncharacterized protein si:ch211-80h18.1 n=1 Tax=Xyrichtys novacula TaxID=13765 RepID=A0AAV1HGE8_XYRNO|nr:uncharacterized protein si:ch211-80h18.1 [Xyrichtys novacula]
MQSLTLLFTGLLVVSLAVMVFSAPVEEKEQEEVEVEVEATDGGEGELSEEEEDDDDSKSQDRIDEAGVVGVQQTTAMAAVPGGSASSILSVGGGTNDGTAGGSVGGGTKDGTAGGSAGGVTYDGTAGGGANDGTAGGSAGGGGTNDGTAGGSAGGGGTNDGTAGGGTKDGTAGGSAGGGTNDGTAGGSAGGGTNEGMAGGSAGFEGVESDTHINGQKLLNGAGAGGGGASSHTGNLGSFGGGVTHLDYTGGFDSSGHDFLLSLMGGGDPFGPGVYLNGPGDMTPPTQLDSTAFGSSVTPIQSAHLDSGSSLDSHAVSSSSSSSSSPLVHSDSDREQTGGAESADVNGNGRLTLLSDTNGAGAAQPVTDLHGDRTASDDGHSHHHTESSPVISFTNSQQPGGNFQADLVTMVTESTGTNTGHPGAATENTQTAGPVTEQYHPSGQGPEGAENVELEDTC